MAPVRSNQRAEASAELGATGGQWTPGIFDRLAHGFEQGWDTIPEGSGNRNDRDLADLAFELLEIRLGTGLVHLVGDDHAGTLE